MQQRAYIQTGGTTKYRITDMINITVEEKNTAVRSTKTNLIPLCSEMTRNRM